MVKRQEREKTTVGPLRAAAVGGVLLALLFLLPLALLPPEEEPQPTPELPQPSAPLPAETQPAVPSPASGWDARETLRVLRADGTVEEQTMADYLWGVVAAEMPASFHVEALKAQAVAARTYCVYQRAGGGDKHPGADVCANYACCQAYLTRDQAMESWGTDAQRWADKVTQAVTETDGLLCLYQGEPIDAVFFSSTVGQTSGAMEVWGTDVPYLTAVASPEGEEVPGWHTLVTFTPQEFADRVHSADPGADFTGAPESWITGLEADQTGSVTSVTLGGVPFNGNQVRSILGLRSAHFTAEATAEQVRFRVTGYGHGVGMSQYGANAFAGEGKNFREILEWYYTGVTVAPLEETGPSGD